jgi:hypothetical protein
MKIFSISVLSAFILAFSLLPTTVVAGSEWLVGVWELHYDPDGDTKDWVEFTADGKAYSIDSKHTRKVPGTYEVTSSSVQLTFSWKGKLILIVFTYKPSKDALYAFSKKTGNTSIYKKIK